MGFLKVALQNVPEPQVIPEGEEAQVELTGFIKDASDNIERTNTNGDPYILPTFKVMNHPDVDGFSHYVPLPSESMTAEDYNKTARRLVAFLKAMDCDVELGRDIEMEFEELVGKQGWAIMAIEPYQGVDKNKAKSFIAPK